MLHKYSSAGSEVATVYPPLNYPPTPIIIYLILFLLQNFWFRLIKKKTKIWQLCFWACPNDPFEYQNYPLCPSLTSHTKWAVIYRHLFILDFSLLMLLLFTCFSNRCRYNYYCILHCILPVMCENLLQSIHDCYNWLFHLLFLYALRKIENECIYIDLFFHYTLGRKM